MSNRPKKVTLQFLGAAKTVTGSKTLLTYGDKKILIDCGLFQGPKEIRQRNWDPLENAEKIDAIILTHAHVDHSGYLPKVVKEGFKGPIYCSSGTHDLCRILLPDSAHLQEEDAKFANYSKHSRHNPAKPLYRVADAYQALEHFKTLPQESWEEIFPGLSVKLLRSGHILGSSLVQIAMSLENKVKTITFSGDLGNNRLNVIKGPVNFLNTDYLVLEGTYGDRVQVKEDPSLQLAKSVKEIHASGGVLVIPAFAVGRTQEILFLLRKLESEKKIPEVPVFLDSPLANEATDIYLKHKDELKLHLSEKEAVEPLCSHCYTKVTDASDSQELCQRKGPMVVISAAGMLSGGRVLHHLKARLPDSKNQVLFVGFQAEQTKGRLLQQGMLNIRLHHEEVPVKAKIVSIESLSAHADTVELVNWVKEIENPPQKVFLNHGEEGPLRALKYRLQHELGLKVEIPRYGEECILE